MALPFFVVAMGGLGDSVYQRPLVRELARQRGEVLLQTPWPELFEDLAGVKFCVPIGMDLRTQLKNVQVQDPSRWEPLPRNAQTVRPRYALRGGLTILQELMASVRLPADMPVQFDLPDMGPPPVVAPKGKPLAVLRPVTVRTEWANTARAPKPEYVAQAATVLRMAGYHVVAVADIDPPAEWLEGAMPEADEYYVKGELRVRELVALIQKADVVVGGVGFIVPVTIAAGTALVTIAGGQGGHNAPHLVTDKRMDLRRARWVMPRLYCPCHRRGHPCNKEIPGFPAAFREKLLEAVGVRD